MESGLNSIHSPKPTIFPTVVDLAAMLAIFFMATLVGGGAMLALNRFAPGTEREIVNIIVYCVQFPLAIGGIYGYRRLRSASGVRIMDSPFRFTFKWYNSSLLLWGIVLIFAASITMEPLLRLFPDRWFELLGNTIGRGGWAVLLTVVLAPVFEETLFRGLILEPSRQKWGAAAGIVISATLFGLVHAPILPQMVNAFVMGIVLGYIYVLTDSLIPVIVIHAVNNAIAYLLLDITGSQNTDMHSLVGNDGIYWIAYGVSAAIFAGSMLFMILAAHKKNSVISKFPNLLIIIIVMMSCKEFPNPFEGEQVLARAGGETLRRMDMEKDFPAGITGADSVLWLESYVDRWVRERLKLEEARRLFGDDAADEQLVQIYRNSLITRRLEQYYISRSTGDSLCTEKELRSYYDRNMRDFVLDRTIVKGRVIALPVAFRQKNRAKELMREYTAENRTDLVAMADKNGFALREIERWTEYPAFLELLPTRRNESYDGLLRKQGLQEMVDGETTWWFVITEARTPGMTIPYEMAREMVRATVTTRRKAEIVKAHEDSIVRTAIFDKRAVINL